MERNKLSDVVTAVQAGERSAMEELFKEYNSDFYYFALKTVKDEDLAYDITQESFIEIINTIDKLQEPAAFVTWAKTIVYHQCTKYFKRTKNKQEVYEEDDEDGNSIFDTFQDDRRDTMPEAAYEDEEFQKTVRAMIEELSEEQRSAVMLYYFEEMSVRDIAQIQKTSEGTVKSRLNYARKALKKTVEDYEKKTGTKLHCFAILPLLLLFFGGKKTFAAERSQEMWQAVSHRTFGASTSSAASHGAVQETARTASQGAGAAGQAGIAANAAGSSVVKAGLSVGAKIAIALAAVALTAGIGAAVIQAVVPGGIAGVFSGSAGGQETQEQVENGLDNIIESESSDDESMEYIEEESERRLEGYESYNWQDWASVQEIIDICNSSNDDKLKVEPWFFNCNIEDSEGLESGTINSCLAFFDNGYYVQINYYDSNVLKSYQVQVYENDTAADMLVQECFLEDGTNMSVEQFNDYSSWIRDPEHYQPIYNWE